jgi:hypothetical protein
MIGRAAEGELKEATRAWGSDDVPSVTPARIVSDSTSSPGVSPTKAGVQLAFVREEAPQADKAAALNEGAKKKPPALARGRFDVRPD